MTGSTEFLQIIAANDLRLHLTTEAKQTIILLKSPDGLNVAMQSGGLASSRLELPTVIFDDFEAASLIERVGAEPSGAQIYALTQDGRNRAD